MTRPPARPSNRWRSLPAEDVAQLCAGAEGATIGLPPVDDTDLNAVRLHATTCSPKQWEDAKTLALATQYSSECGQPRGEMTDDELGDHLWTPDGDLLVDCEGYHTPLLRAIRNNLRIAGML